MTEHTKGPWEHDDNIFTYDYIINEKREQVARIEQKRYGDDDRFDIPLEERMANARLIAAAPDMLEALELFIVLNTSTAITEVDGKEHHENLNRKVQAAIAKATGEE